MIVKGVTGDLERHDAHVKLLWRFALKSYGCFISKSTTKILHARLLLQITIKYK